MHISYRTRAATIPNDTQEGALSIWGEFQVKDGRRVVARFPTLREARAKFPDAAVRCNPRADETDHPDVQSKSAA